MSGIKVEFLETLRFLNSIFFKIFWWLAITVCIHNVKSSYASHATIILKVRNVALGILSRRINWQDLTLLEKIDGM